VLSHLTRPTHVYCHAKRAVVCTCLAGAPEVIRRESQSEAADWWSLGVVLAYTATGVHPFRRHWQECTPLELCEQGTGQAVRMDADGTGCSSSAEPAAATPVAPASKSKAKASAKLSPIAPAEDAECGYARPIVGVGGEGKEEPKSDSPPVKWTEAELNENTLHMPIQFDRKALGEELHNLLEGLLRRDAAHRLGARSSDEVTTHRFWAAIDRKMLERQILLAPWVPDAGLVYAKDRVERHSHGAQHAQDDPDVNNANKATGETDDVESDWPFCPGEDAYQLELREYAVKLSAWQLVTIDEAPDDPNQSARPSQRRKDAIRAFRIYARSMCCVVVAVFMLFVGFSGARVAGSVGSIFAVGDAETWQAANGSNSSNFTQQQGWETQTGNGRAPVSFYSSLSPTPSN
jgi:serine/threonine protein kinase